jgi:hypothetical protein
MVDKLTRALTLKGMANKKVDSTINPDGFDEKAYENIKTTETATAGETGGKVVFVNGKIEPKVVEIK